MQFACNRKEIFYISLLSLFVRKLVESENIENRAELQDKKTSVIICSQTLSLSIKASHSALYVPATSHKINLILVAPNSG